MPSTTKSRAALAGGSFPAPQARPGRMLAHALRARTHGQAGWSLLAAVKTARDLYVHNKEAFRRLQQNGFSMRFTWDAAAKEYVETLYKPVL